MQAQSEAGGCTAKMASLIEDEIIPKLIAAHRVDCTSLGSTLHRSDSYTAGFPRFQQAAAPAQERLAPDSIADSALSPEPGVLMDLVDRALATGLSTEALLVDILAPAARCLGNRWDADTADFIDVTIGLWRMQEIVHDLAARRSAAPANAMLCPDTPYSRRILFAVAPGDTHSFGSVMLEEMFLRAGWFARDCRDGHLADLEREVAGHWFDIIALTISIDQHSGAIEAMIAALRKASRNPDVRVMVGGKVFLDRPELAIAVGADATASDARAALKKANHLVEQSHLQRFGPQAAQQLSGHGAGSAHALRSSAH